jgi:hypothetical protein
MRTIACQGLWWRHLNALLRATSREEDHTEHYEQPYKILVSSSHKNPTPPKNVTNFALLEEYHT